MARTTFNRALTEIRGTIDGLTYRMRPDGKASVYGHQPSTKPPSKTQLAKRKAFAAAQNYARDVLADPLQRKVYQAIAQERQRPTNTVLVANYLNPPAIDCVELDRYSGGAGQEIAVIASDDIAVATVGVEIRGTDNASLEAGLAQPTHGVWRYRSTTAIPAGTRWRVTITATNRAGHAALLTLPDPRDPGGPAPVRQTRLPAQEARRPRG